MESSSVDALITDPPAGIKIFDHEWDSDKGGREAWVHWLSQIMVECHRILKPGAHGLIWAIPKKSHWTALALESAGFQIKDIISHVFATGFPKSQDLEKATLTARHLDSNDVLKVVSWIRQRKQEMKLTNQDIDHFVGIKGGACHWTNNFNLKQAHVPTPETWKKLKLLIGPASKEIEDIIHNQSSLSQKNQRLELAKKCQGWGTQLKPAHENWILIQKQPESFNLVSNVLKHGTGGLNIDSSRIPTTDKIATAKSPKLGYGIWNHNDGRPYIYKPNEGGRFPANLILSAAESVDCQSTRLGHDLDKASKYFKCFSPDPFVFSNKPTKSEKEKFNNHPTVKPVELMQYFCRLITPIDGVILDPFMGSGSTGVAAIQSGFKFLGIEKESNYFDIATKRIEHAKINL